MVPVAFQQVVLQGGGLSQGRGVGQCARWAFHHQVVRLYAWLARKGGGGESEADVRNFIFVRRRAILFIIKSGRRRLVCLSGRNEEEEVAHVDIISYHHPSSSGLVGLFPRRTT